MASRKTVPSKKPLSSKRSGDRIPRMYSTKPKRMKRKDRETTNASFIGTKRSKYTNPPVRAMTMLVKTMLNDSNPESNRPASRLTANRTMVTTITDFFISRLYLRWGRNRGHWWRTGRRERRNKFNGCPIGHASSPHKSVSSCLTIHNQLSDLCRCLTS